MWEEFPVLVDGVLRREELTLGSSVKRPVGSPVWSVVVVGGDLLRFCFS